jgi:hypothetical protein
MKLLTLGAITLIGAGIGAGLISTPVIGALILSCSGWWCRRQPTDLPERPPQVRRRRPVSRT